MLVWLLFDVLEKQEKNGSFFGEVVFFADPLLSLN